MGWDRRKDADGKVAPTWDSITAVGDCAPAARALNLGASGSAQMRVLLRAACNTTRHWLGVAVPREWNLDADRLSHPTLYDEVEAEASAAGLHPERATVPKWAWDVLRAAMALPLASADTGGE